MAKVWVELGPALEDCGSWAGRWGWEGGARSIALNLQQLQKDLNLHPPHPAILPQGPITPVHSLGPQNTFVSSEG